MPELKHFRTLTNEHCHNYMGHKAARFRQRLSMLERETAQLGPYFGIAWAHKGCRCLTIL